MRNFRLALLFCGLLTGVSQASAAVLNLEPPSTGGTPFYTYTQGGYMFTSAPNGILAPFTVGYFSEIDYAANGWDADYPGSAIGMETPFGSNVLTKDDGSAFNFHGISLTDIYNSGAYAGGVVDFTFNHTDGTITTSSVTLGSGTGFTAYAFSENNLTSLTFSTTPSSYAVQFDYVSVDTSISAVPLPASLPMFGAALLALGGIGYGLNRRGNTGSGTATAA